MTSFLKMLNQNHLKLAQPTYSFVQWSERGAAVKGGSLRVPLWRKFRLLGPWYETNDRNVYFWF
jgi:hypothetical protein